MKPASPSSIIGAFVAAMAVVSGQQQQQQFPGAASTGSPNMGGFTPIRLIQPQTPEQQQAIQNLVDELRKSSPQLFSSIGQGNGQQVAIALPPTAPSAGTISSSPASPSAQQQSRPQPQQQQQQQQQQPQQQQQQQAQPRAPEVPQAPPTTPAATSSAPAGFTANAPTPVETEHVTANSDVPAPISFAVNEMFMSPEDDNKVVGEVSEGQTIPFGLRFDPTSTDSERTESESRGSIHHGHDSNSHSSDDDETDFDFFDDLSDLDSMATTRVAVSLAAIGLSLVSSLVL